MISLNIGRGDASLHKKEEKFKDDVTEGEPSIGRGKRRPCKRFRRGQKRGRGRFNLQHGKGKKKPLLSIQSNVA